MRVRASDGLELSFCLDGEADAPVVMLSSSLGTDTRLWQPLVGMLGARSRVLRYDHRGHGGSGVPQGPATIERLARDALDLLDALDIAQVAFVGLSLGGMVGQWLGAHAPERLHGLVLCNTSAHMPPPQAWDARIAAVRAGGMAAVADAVLDRWFTPGFRDRQPAIVSEARAMLLDTPPEGYAACCTAIRDMDLRPLLAQVRVPTLVVGGLSDPATPPDHAECLASRIRGSQLAMLETAHLSAMEAPGLLAACIGPFLAACTERRLPSA